MIREKAIGFIKTAVEKDPESFSSNFTAGQILLRCGLGSKGSHSLLQKGSPDRTLK